MTNKTKTILCVCALTASAFAWNATAEDLYGVYDNNVGTFVPRHQDEQGNWIDGYNPRIGAWHIEGSGEGAGGIGETTSFKSVADDAVLSISLERNGNANPFRFGTFTYNEDGSANLSDLLELGSVTKKGDLGLSFYNTGTFDKDEIVGIWIQELNDQGNPTGAIYYSDNPTTLLQTDVASGQYTDGYLEGGDKVAQGVASVWFDIANNGVWGGQEVDGVELGLTEIKFRVTGAAPGDAGKVGTPTGGPLPGVWATIALAGAASTYLKRRKKENK